MAVGRFAPSPSATLHLGNLRTALIAWLVARRAGSEFLLRIEDLDQASARPEHEASAIDHLSRIGIDWDGPIVRQSERRGLHEDALATLTAAGRTYPCYCSRREMLAEAHAAIAAPHGPAAPVGYPGTCRDLSTRGRSEREAAGRKPSLRLRADAAEMSFVDQLVGPVSGVVDDFVVRRADGMPAYNVVVVVDDHDQGIGEVVRGDDLVSTTPRQLLVAQMLGFDSPMYAHVPLVLDPGGERLAKRHGAVTLDDQNSLGRSDAQIHTILAASLGLADVDEPVTADLLVERFTIDRLPPEPWILPQYLLEPVT
jgi:glutamyl-tRNA synthetase